MGGRGKPGRAKSSNSNPKETNPTSPVSSSHTTFEEEKQNKPTKKTKTEDQQKHTEEKPCAPKTVRGRTINRFTEMTNKQQDLPADSTKTKTCSARKKSMKTTPGCATNSQLKPETPTDIPEVKPPICKAKQVHFTKETNKTEAQQPVEKMKTELSRAATMKPAAAKTRAKICANKAPCEGTEVQPDGSEKLLMDNKESILRMTLDKLKIRKKDQSEAAQVINDFKKKLIKYLKEKSESFKEVEEPLNTGSYYENLKISNPDEFDIMLPIPVDRVEMKSFGTNRAFYSVELKRDRNPLKKFQLNNILSSCEMLKEFRKEVQTFAKDLSEWKLTRKKPGCPAVTLTTEVESTTISLDVVLCLKVKSSWPEFTKHGFKIEQWLGTKVKQEHKWKPFYLVPKHEGRGNVENDGVAAKDVWRISFSHIEKDIIKNHGSEKTCCEKCGESCCRKDCLKLLKHLLHLCKKKDPSLDKFCSYHAKTTLFHACCSRTKDSEWKASDLSHCFELLLQDFEGYLRNGELCNFFIPTQNLLSDLGKKCITLADCIKEQREMGFPVFKQDL